jgi:hypothetical protein
MENLPGTIGDRVDDTDSCGWETGLDEVSSSYSPQMPVTSRAEIVDLNKRQRE